MKSLALLLLFMLAACSGDWRQAAVNDAEALVRDQVKDPSLQFSRVQFTGDDRSGQTCGYYTIRTADGGEASIRFISFIDGNRGENPFIDLPSAPYPTNKDDFDLAWRSECLDLGYKDV